MICKKCGNVLEPEDLFCGECGTRVTTEEPAETVDNEPILDEVLEDNNTEESSTIEEKEQLDVTTIEVQNSEVKTKLSEKTWFVILFLILFWPVGLFLMWKHKKFSNPVRIIISIVLIATAIFAMLPSNSDDNEYDSGNTIVSETFGFTDEEFIEWANIKLDGDYIVSDGVIMEVEGDNYYRIVNSSGEEGVILLAHEESSDQVTAIGVGFEDVSAATDVACKFGVSMASSFSYEAAYDAVMDNSNYTSGGMIIYKLPSGEDTEMVVLFTTAYYDTLLESNDGNVNDTDIIEIESVEQLVDNDEYLNKRIKVRGLVNYEDVATGMLKMYGAYSDLEVFLQGSENYPLPESECAIVTGVASQNEYGELVITVENLEPCIDQECTHNEVYY